jgi:hypothetical protein
MTCEESSRSWSFRLIGIKVFWEGKKKFYFVDHSADFLGGLWIRKSQHGQRRADR